MAVSRVVLLLVLAGALAVNAVETKPSSGLFVDWLSKQQSPKAKSASYYEVESESACLQEIALRNCRTCDTGGEPKDDDCKEEYVEAKVGCCHHDSYGQSDDVLAEAPSVGVCSYSKTFFDEEITYEGTGTTKIGTFTATCELKDDSDKCGSPLCEGMSITATGDILKYPKVAFVHHPEVTESECPKEGDKKALAKAMDYKEYDGPKFWLGEAEIYSGTFYTVSRHHKIPYKFGQYQLVNVLPDVKYEDCEDLPEKAYVAKPNAIALEFYKNTDY